MALRCIASLASHRLPQAQLYTIHNALSGCVDPRAANKTGARFAAHGFDQHAISLEVYAQARETFVLFESLLNAAQTRRLRLLKNSQATKAFLVCKTSSQAQAIRRVQNSSRT